MIPSKIPYNYFLASCLLKLIRYETLSWLNNSTLSNKRQIKNYVINYFMTH